MADEINIDRLFNPDDPNGGTPPNNPPGDSAPPSTPPSPQNDLTPPPVDVNIVGSTIDVPVEARDQTELSNHFRSLDSHLEKIKEALDTVNESIKEQTGPVRPDGVKYTAPAGNSSTGRSDESSSKTAEQLTKERIAAQDWINALDKAKAEIEDIFVRGPKAYAKEMEKIGMRVQDGKYVVPAGDGAPERRVTREQLLNDEISEQEKSRIKDAMAERKAAGINTQKPTFRIGEIIRDLATGNVGGAVGELFQPTAHTQKWGASLTRVGADRAAAGMAGGAAMRLAGTALMSTGPGEVAALAYGAKRLNQFNLGQERVGMAAGLQGQEAREEGYRATAESLRMGLNPFDQLSRGAALEIAKGVRSRGFQKTVATAWTDSVGDVVKDLGVSATTALESMSLAVDTFGMTAGQFREQMAGLDDTAKKSQLSVETVIKSVQQWQKLGAEKGGTQAGLTSGRVSQGLMRAFAGLPGAGEGGALQLGLQKSWPNLAASFLGLTPQQAWSDEGQQRIPEAIDLMLDQWLAEKEARGYESNADFAREIIVPSGWGETWLGLEPGGGVNIIEGLLNRRSQKGKTIKVNGQDVAVGKNFTKRADAAARKDALQSAPEAARKNKQRGFWSRAGSAFRSLTADGPVAMLLEPAVRDITGGKYGRTLGEIREDYASTANKITDSTVPEERKAFIQSLNTEMKAQGFPKEERDKILSELKRDKSSSEVRFGEERRTATMEAQEFTLKFHPDVARYFEALDTSRIKSNTGAAGRQGTVPPPAIR